MTNEAERLEAEDRLLHPEIYAWLDDGNRLADYQWGDIWKKSTRKRSVNGEDSPAKYATNPKTKESRGSSS
jgi:hypothetical protein